MKNPSSYHFTKDNPSTPIYGSSESDHVLPKKFIPDRSLAPHVAYRMVADEILHDSNPRYNLASFVQTYMEPEAQKIMIDTMAVNAIDKTEYPQTTAIENHCMNMLANLWNIKESDSHIGTSTLGSSEACILAGIAMIFRWKRLAKTHNIPLGKLNLIVGSGVQVVWEKFCVYWDIELRVIPMTDFKDLRLNPKNAVKKSDDYTIGIVAIMGITYTGLFDDVVLLDHEVEQYNKTHKITLPIHIDAASGGLFLPFVNPLLEWDFRLKNVVSINTSGHKFGLVYPGIGWIIWRDKKFLDEKLLFTVNYLGTSFSPEFQLNFSRPGSQIWAQYFNFVRFGKEGYKAIHEKSKDVAIQLSEQIKKMSFFHLLNDGSNIPIVCWCIKNAPDKPKWTLYDLSEVLKRSGWQVPAYPLPENFKDVIVMRVVVRADFSRDQLSLFLEDLKTALDILERQSIYTPHPNTPSGFNH